MALQNNRQKSLDIEGIMKKNRQLISRHIYVHNYLNRHILAPNQKQAYLNGIRAQILYLGLP